MGPPWRAEKLAQVHEGRRQIPRLVPWKQFLHARQHGISVSAPAHEALDGEDSRDDPRDVRVGRGDPQTKREGGDRRGRVLAKTGEPSQRFRIRREAAGVIAKDSPGGSPEVPGSGVVAKPGPGREHTVLTRASQRRQIRKSLEEMLVSGLDRADRRLLEHHFGDPDPVGIAVSAPRKRPILSPKPAQELPSDLNLGGRRKEVSFCQEWKASIQSSNVPMVQAPYHTHLCLEAWDGDMSLKIDWEGLIVGFESRSQQITHFFDRETGDVEQVLERDAARHTAMSRDPRYLALPRDRGERSRGDLEEFLAQCQDGACRRELEAGLKADNFASRYRETLMRFPKEESRFFQFKEHQALKRAQTWLASMGVAFRPPLRSPEA